MDSVNEDINYVFVNVSEVNLLDKNPRINKPVRTQEEIFDYLISTTYKNYGEKTYNLAKNIAKNGLNKSNLPVLSKKDENGKYIVFEGNRRFCALKALCDNENIKDAQMKQKYSNIVQKFNYNNIKIKCYIAKDKDEARWIMNLTHEGEQEGVGTSPWDTLEKQRFKTGGDLLVLLYDYIRVKQLYDGNLKKDIPPSVLKRILPKLKGIYQVDVANGKIITKLKRNKFDEYLVKLLKELKNEDTRSLNNQKDQARFLGKLKENDVLPEKKDFSTKYSEVDIESSQSSFLDSSSQTKKVKENP